MTGLIVDLFGGCGGWAEGLRSLGLAEVGDVPADTWHRPSRPRLDADLFGEPVTPEGDKVRWIWGAAA